MKKNILILVPSLKMGGQEKVAVHTSKLLSDTYQLWMAVFNNKNVAFEPKCEVIDINVPPLDGKLNKVINVIKRVNKIKLIKKNLKIDVTLSFGLTANLVNVLSQYKDMTLVSIRGYNQVKKSIISRLVYNKANKICCVSHKMAEDLINIHNISKDKVAVLYNPYNYGEIQELSNRSIDMEISHPSIISVGRLVNDKGYHHLLRALKIAIKDIKDLKLFFVGDGILKEELIKQAIELGIENNVIFVGYKDNPYSYIKKCDLFVLPSINEGFPNALVEAMACGIPVIATDCKTGPREILTKTSENKVTEKIEYGEFGILVPPFESNYSNEIEKEQFLATAIIEMLKNKKRYEYYRIKSVQRVNDFTKDRYKNTLINLIESLS